MSPFRVLFREFFEQFFASESVTSDMRMRQAMIAVMAFMLTPGYMLAASSFTRFAAALALAPQTVEPLTRMFTTIFMGLSTVSISLIAAFAWEALTLDRRDAMVLGPLPISRATVVGAKLSAMGAFLLGACLAINLPTAMMFSLSASGHRGPAAVVRHFFAHLIATSSAAIFVFCAVVILRALVGMVSRGHVAAALSSLLQFAFVSALFAFVFLVPAIDNRPANRRGAPVNRAVVNRAVVNRAVVNRAVVNRAGVDHAVAQPERPRQMPTDGFVAMSEQLRGAGGAKTAADARGAALVTLTVVAGAALLTLAGYCRQLQGALAPAASTGAIGGARLIRGVARALSGSNRVAHAISDFILMTIVRNRAQQAPIVFNAALGLGMIMVRFGARDVSGIPLLQRPDFLLGIPLMLTFWVFVGLRASFFVPSELPAAWTFRANAPENTNAYVLGARAAMIALVAPPAVLLALGLAAPLVDWTGAIQHALFVLLLVAAFADFTVLTVESIPFTRPYIPGHAKLKARWPLYVFGPLGFAWGLAALELLAWTATNGGTILLSFAVFVVVIFELAVRRAGHYWPAPTDDTPTDDESAVTVLDLAGFAQT